MKIIGSALTAVLALGIGVAAAGAAGVPPEATTGAVTSVTPKSAVVTGTVNPKGTSTTWQFEYGLASSSGYTNATAMTSAGAGTSDESVSATLKGLTAATSYRYRIVATSSAGTVDGAAGVFNTSTPPTALTDAASHVDVSSATLNGLVDPEGTATSWFFEYGTTTSYGSKTPAKTIAAGPNQVAVSAALTGLSPNTTYHFRLVASSTSGKAYGIDFSFTTNLPVTIGSLDTSITYGGSTQLTGTVLSGSSGVAVTIEYEQFDQSSYTGLAVVTSGPGGAWSYVARPTVRTSYEASVGGVSSSPVVIGVRPAVSITNSKSGVLSTSVTGAMSFADHVLQLQRLSDGTWVTWKHVRLNAKSTTRFVTALPVGRTEIRMAIGPFVPGVDQAGPGYLAGFSRTIVYTRS